MSNRRVSFARDHLFCLVLIENVFFVSSSKNSAIIDQKEHERERRLILRNKRLKRMEMGLQS